MQIIDMLKGKKTYIIAALIGAVAAAKYLGYLDAETADILLVLLTGGGLATIRAGIAAK